MKTISGLTTDEKQMIVNVLENPTVKGQTTIKDIRMIDKVCKHFEIEGDTVELEDSDHAYMMTRIKEFGSWLANEASRKLILPLAEKLGI